jgi:C-terminal processing protease CtpA/Prc
MKLSQSFYDLIKDSLKAKNLIVDLRNNTGGAEKVSNKFLTLLRGYAKSGKIYVLMNNGTMSRGEIFILQLKKIKGVKTFGQSTRGTLAYGSNFGKRERLPGGKFEVYLTDMKDKANYFQYEGYGVNPEIVLDNDANWISKLIKKINEEQLGQ